ncbi:mycothione reductase [Actinokineospora alba]|uniref:Mycothione reductase n=1 Tax=Actinokineospora alba TaxID=504798 RepID=A0A1H0I920_9PSEU|nr:mycothione reductase [Actinokineospora alba]SDI87446.1 mycothione reductase [Actinokineospora alba]SDO27959.1 mycothione reductase [Actinokineospora alba]
MGFDGNVRHFDLIIIGTGSGNSLLDPRFADLDVAMVERGVFGGTCINVGCIPTKMFVHAADLAATPKAAARLGVDETLDGVRWPEIRDRIFGRIDPIAVGGKAYREEHPDNANVTLYTGDARFVGERRLEIDGQETITADRIVLAAGGRPVVPAIEGIDDVEFHTSDTVMRLDELPARMVILGGGFIAAEFAHVFSSFGVEVTVVVRSGALLRREDRDISARFTELARARWDVRLDRKIERVERSGDGVRVRLVGDEVIDTDVLLVAAGRTPNSDQLDVAAGGIKVDDHGYVVVDEFQRASAEGVWALGDICSPWELKHVANHEARVVQHNLLNPDKPLAADHRFVPHAVFTSPQIASVGLTEQEAQRQGVDYVTATQEYAGIAYGWAMEDTTGFAKLLADPKTGQLIGAHIIGPQASTVIQPVIQAMSFGLDARAMAQGQYWIHPAMPELIENALLKLPLEMGH